LRDGGRPERFLHRTRAILRWHRTCRGWPEPLRAAESSTAVKQFSLTGALLAGGFNIGTMADPVFITVVPNAVPEPSSFAMSFAGLTAIGVYSWRRLRRVVA